MILFMEVLLDQQEKLIIPACPVKIFSS